MIMAKDSDGRKFNRIPEYNRVQNGKTIHVSTLNTQSTLSSWHFLVWFLFLKHLQKPFHLVTIQPVKERLHFVDCFSLDNG